MINTLFENEDEQRQGGTTALTDLNTGEKIEIIVPGKFVLETVLVHSAIYCVDGREYRFHLPAARIAGLKIQK